MPLNIENRPLLRRSLSISAISLTAVLLTASAPLWLPLAAAFDRFRGRSALACLSFIGCFAWMELAGVLALFAVWVARPALSDETWTRANFAIQLWWTTTLLACAQRLFGIRLVVEGAEQANAAPQILLPRHVSFGDTVFACALVSAPFGIRHRYILKGPLRWDPCIDVAGHRLGCTFVERGRGQGHRHRATIRQACAELAAREGVLIYPEGTRHTPAKRRERLDQLRRHEPAALPLASAMQHVLYPHKLGTFAAFEGAGFPDAVFLAHSGFEGSARFVSLWRGELRGAVVRLRFWRVPGDRIPREADGFSTWLLSQWQQMDRVVGDLAENNGKPSPTGMPNSASGEEKAAVPTGACV